ncbi:MAG: hypothetical protein BGP05_13600 [Rhizobiales bacterium 62-47]|nr:hypothetical protein [Hyphomicrobiales bacterium]OJY11276.1 MAG: hypothetical protein BGP05_13600 [Rhizobiales bacterium 62-47]
MTVTQNPIASGHLPSFITPPGQTDVLFHIVAWFVLLCVIGLGVLFFTIHSLPERVAHRTKKVQLDIVAVLCLLALFTNEHVFWIAALLLAFIDLPDFLTPVQRIASAAEKIAGGEMKAQSSDAVDASTAAAAAPVSTEAERPEGAPPIQKGAAHA